MKKFYFISIILIFTALTSGCQKEIYEEHTGVSDHKGHSEITAFFADSQDKTVLNEKDASVLWNPRDQILIFYNTARIKFTSTNTTPSKSATFISEYNLIFGGLGDNSETKSEKPGFYGIYPYSDNNTQSTTSDDLFQIYIPALQKGIKGSFARTSFPAVGRSSDTGMAFYNVCGGICFSLTESGVQYVTIEGNSSEVLAGYASVTVNPDGRPSSNIEEGAANSSRVTLVAPSKEGFEVMEMYYISMLPNTFSNGITMTFHKADAVATLSTGNQLEIKRSTFGRIYAADHGLEYVPSPAVEEVDLGLPVNWASCNVGALIPEEVGTYFAQGDTNGQTWDGVDWSGYGFQYSPYYQTDSLDILLPKYDAATVNLGEKWRMPTVDDYQKLFDNTKKTWTVNYNNSGVAGAIFKSTVPGYEDKQIFMPLSGYGYIIGLYLSEKYGFYWTANLNYCLEFARGGHMISAYNELCGFLIRPVCASTNPGN